ncbi:MAG: hypothetical protein HQL35_10600 [Alphaproteobacteria bacterium]|nr:hypothetical protein [Alphaproteobacteria bacterium]
MSRIKKDAPDEAARFARLIARAASKGALATNRHGANRPDAPRLPYVSKVAVALDEAGRPVFLLSTIATHTQDLMADGHAALLVETPPAAANPMQDARATVMGSVTRLSDGEAETARARFLTRHPQAALYAGFGDFGLWRMAVERVHYVGGFGRSKWAKGADYRLDAEAFAGAAPRLMDELGAKLADDLSAAITAAWNRSPRGWKPLAVDPDGLDLSGPKGTLGRIDFPSPALDARAWRTRLRALTRKAG